jgi:hypothetical protein
VLLLGDSMFWGLGIQEEDMIDRVIERVGQSDFDDNIGRLSVYNYSVSGYNTVQELIISREYSDMVSPDLIILGFFTGNDVITNALTEIDSDGNIATNEEKVEFFKSELKRTGLYLRSAIFRVLAHYGYVPRLRNLVSVQERVVSESYALLKEFAKEARERGAGFAVVIIPTRHAVENGLARYWTTNRPVGRLLYSFCENHQIDVLDALDFMDGGNASDRYFSSEHEHFTKEGAEIMGTNMYRRLILPHYEAQRRAGNKVRPEL